MVVRPIVRWYFGLEVRNFRGVVVRQLKFRRASMWKGSGVVSLVSTGVYLRGFNFERVSKSVR